ncbi:DUF2179 domain-containing protein [Desulfosporosinus sp. OT]|uniref:DUF2179 domain-containing protein n=1 Tax=Desulfosporosinus sp. OT TaxID=913865 RepID=UPI001FA7A228|nr:DUF2179 domain-containing protein [Desulfosporosinus sp. OT]
MRVREDTLAMGVFYSAITRLEIAKLKSVDEIDVNAFVTIRDIRDVYQVFRGNLKKAIHKVCS